MDDLERVYQEECAKRYKGAQQRQLAENPPSPLQEAEAEIKRLRTAVRSLEGSLRVVFRVVAPYAGSRR